MKTNSEGNGAEALMPAEFLLQLPGRICLTNVSETGIDEPRRYVVLIVLKPITAATASGPLWSDAAAGRQKGSPAAAHLAAAGPQEAAGEAQGQRAMGLQCIKDAAPNAPRRDIKALQPSLQPTNNVE